MFISLHHWSFFEGPKMLSLFLCKFISYHLKVWMILWRCQSVGSVLVLVTGRKMYLIIRQKITKWHSDLTAFNSVLKMNELTEINIFADHTITDCNLQKKSILLKVTLQILGRKLYKNTKKSSLYSQSLLIFIHKTLMVENHPITRVIRELLLSRLRATGITVYFYMSSSLIYQLEIQRRKFQT